MILKKIPIRCYAELCPTVVAILPSWNLDARKKNQYIC